ncbi:MAG TPA: inosine-5-monophosphate dehydrogenase [Halieaceae bacterium]|nr:inosine-5-monophosphate dehydrogenase [Halieaceae bacterium]
MIVRDVMTTGVLYARPSEEVRSVVTKMLSRHCGAVPVVDDNHSLLGMVAVRDVLLPLYPNLGDYVHDSVQSRNFLDMEEGYVSVLGKKVEEVMSRNPRTVSPEDPVLKAASLMGVHNFRRMPVVEDNQLVGMVSIGDINRGLFFQLSSQ